MITSPEGEEYSVLDLISLYEMRRRVLPPQRAQAIEMYLYHDMRESDAAVAMGCSPTTPVAMYATQGLRQLAAAWDMREGEGGGLPADDDAAAERDLQGA